MTADTPLYHIVPPYGEVGSRDLNVLVICYTRLGTGIPFSRSRVAGIQHLRLDAHHIHFQRLSDEDLKGVTLEKGVHRDTLPGRKATWSRTVVTK